MSTMLSDKQCMVLETVSIFLLVTQSDVPIPRQSKFEFNEHTYVVGGEF